MTRIEEDRLIQNARSLPLARRTFWGLVTAVFWVLYVYLWLPLITFVMWYLGIRQARLELYLRNHSFDPYLLIVLPIIAVLTGLALVAWAEYNRNRFGGGDRRNATPPVPHKTIVFDLGGNSEIAAALAEHRVCVLHMNEDAVPTGATGVNLAVPALGAGAEDPLPLKYRQPERADHEPAPIQQLEPQTGTVHTGKS